MQGMRKTLEPEDALRLLGGGPVVLVTTRWRTTTDVMPAIWTTPLSRRPPLVGVAVHAGRLTHDMIKFSEQFALNFPAQDMLNHTHYFGAVSGADVGKLELSRLPTIPAKEIEAPLIDGCVAYVECAVEDTMRTGDHTLFIGRVVAVQAEEDSFDTVWSVGPRDYRPLHYLGTDQYAVLGDRLTAVLRTTDDGAIELAETAEERERREEEEAREAERRQREGEPE